MEQKVEEKKKAMAELEDAAQNHFEGVGAVMNAEVSFSDDEDLGFDDDGEFIDGGKRFCECLNMRLLRASRCAVELFDWSGLFFLR